MTVIQLKTPASERAEKIINALECLVDDARDLTPKTLICLLTFQDDSRTTAVFTNSVDEAVGGLELMKFTLLDAHMEDDE